MILQGWNTVLMALIFSFPAVTSVICAVIVAVYGRTARNVPRRLIVKLIAALSASAIAWGCVVLYLQWPVLFVVFQTAFYYSILMFQVLFYRIICLITNTGKKERFSCIHYIVPAVIPVILLVWSLFVPLGAQVYIVESRGQAMPGYETYTALFTSKAPVLILWSIVYYLLSFKRVWSYRRFIGDYSADEGRSPVRWLRILILYMFWVMIIPLISVGIGKATFTSSLGMIFPALLSAIQIIILCYNIVSENYIAITDEEISGGQVKGNRIKRDFFEHYIATRKPYLNPKLRITDIAADLHSNRTYISNFINSEYGMNFSRYVNRKRLAELELLSLDPASAGLTGMDLILKAGFSNYRAYMRVKNEENKLSLIKNS